VEKSANHDFDYPRIRKVKAKLSTTKICSSNMNKSPSMKGYRREAALGRKGKEEIWMGNPKPTTKNMDRISIAPANMHLNVHTK
jgi:hypothetical protein